MRSSIEALLILALLACGPRALAQPAADAAACAGAAASAEERIAACTRQIDSARLPAAALADAYFHRGRAHRARDDPDRAIADFSESIRLAPRSEGAYVNRGNAWVSKGDYDRAIADYGAAIEVAPQAVIAYRNRGRALDARGEFARAAADFEEAIRRDPRDAEGYNLYAWRLATSADERARNGKRAVELARQACELTAWRDALHLDTLAAAYAEAGDYAEAVRWQEKALELPGFARAYGAEARARLALYRAGRPYRQSP